MSRGDIRVAESVTVTPTRRRDAFTLLELIVVLALMGLGVAIVAPSLVLRPPSSDEAVRRVVASARRVAMRRAQTVSLDIGADGVWRVAGADRDSAEILLSGELDERPRQDVHLRITPLGLCLTDRRTTDSGSRLAVNGERSTDTEPAAGAGSDLAFDPLTCSRGFTQMGSR